MGSKRWCAVSVLLVIAGFVACGSSHVGHAAYVTLSGGNQVAGYKVDSFGKLTKLTSSPYSGGSSPSAICVHPSKKFAYVANGGGGDVSLFTIDASSGALTEASSRTTAGTSPSALAMVVHAR